MSRTSIHAGSDLDAHLHSRCRSVSSSQSPYLGAPDVAENVVRFGPSERIFGRYVSHTPLAYTLFRMAECQAVSEGWTVRPALDLGCGAGEFAAWAVDEPIEAGVDRWSSPLRQARVVAAYQVLAQADAAALPFPDGSFASVLAVSVCEHLVAPAAALAEAFRVLRPGGRFVATIVLADIHDHLFYARLCRGIRLGRLARVYERLHDRVFDHIALYPRGDWERMLAMAGFRLVETGTILSPRLIRWFDFWLITAWPYKLMQWLGMRPFVWRPRWLARLCWKWFQSINEDAGDEGSVLLVVAEKPG